ncbi:long-chain-fatty-acid--CoA ligase 6-like [Myxocyprinus asiaticus]|uniref:long-chain-fatty-acid--CoA ligase 6-like n=1 Tax=Myxocyprinus asiaticus TaxID=70543 RepID=UPI002222F8BA|nr:long-chain-fatty-acid--CoA ligase 6-like [Myxocyprinus asiaticus]
MLIEKMLSRDLLLSLQLPELDDLGQFIQSLPTSTLVGLGVLTTVLAYWFVARPRAIIPPCDLWHQSQEVEMEDGAHKSMISNSSKLLSYYHEDAKTMYEVFQRGLHITGDGPFLGSRLPSQPYKWLSYKEVFSRAEHLGSGLLSHGCQPNTDQFIGVFAQNRPEWIISELACYTYSMVVVPLYDTLGPDAIRYIINTGLKYNLHMYALGREHCRKPVPPQPDDLSIVCFTSGTTGNPKGVMLTHGNVVADFGGFLKVTDKVIFPNQDDVLISFLPLAHMFERLIESAVICHGGRIGFFQGDIHFLPDDMKTLRPTIFPVVPRLLNRMYDKIFSQANTPLKCWLLNFAAKRKGAEVSRGVIRSDSIWDKIFFHKIQASLGGRLRMIITGAAPASLSVLGFLRAALGCQVYEAYGQKECTAGCTFTTPGDWTSGHVGAPLPCNLIKLVDVAEKNYFAAKREGEICVKGPNVFKGYLKDPVRTTEMLDADGWLHTGDIGKWLPNGTLRIIDRKKHIFKLAQGEYISPEKIENIYIRSEPVSQLYVHGDSLQSCLVGIVVPDPEVFPSWAQKKGFGGCFGELCDKKEVKKAILDDMVRLGKASGLHSFEQVKDIHIHKEMFSIQNGLLTPTLKAKRPELKEYFKTEIEQLYSNISM